MSNSPVPVVLHTVCSDSVDDWPDIDLMAAQAPVAEGYRCEPLREDEVPALIELLNIWFPDVSVGGASGYMRESFYRERVHFASSAASAEARDVMVLTLKHADKRGDVIAGMFAFERDCATMSMHATLAAAAPQHRGANLTGAGMAIAEGAARRLGLGLVYGMATLRSLYVQRAFERAGWKLIGITPGYDRELVAPGVVKRVFEAVYAKVLVDDADLVIPQTKNMTSRTRAMFELIQAPELENAQLHTA
jgi:hypothetical protein